MTPDPAVPQSANHVLPPAREQFVHLGDVLVAVLRARRLITVCTTIGIAAGITWALIPVRTWTAEATFLPEQRRQSQSAISGLASQIGLAVGGLDGAQPGVLFVELAKSRDILDSLSSSSPYVEPSGSTVSRPLSEWMHIDETDPKKRQIEVRAKLAAAIDASTSTKTGLVTIRTSLPADWLAAEVANRLIRQLDRVSVRLRQRRAESEKQYTDERMKESATELRVAEQLVATFQSANRDISRSPDRQLELERLNRDAALRQQLFASLANAAQQASLELLRDTPAVTIVQHAALPLQPDRRYIARKAIVGLILGFAGAVIFALLGHFWFAERRAASDDLDEEWRRSRYDFWRPWRLFFGNVRN